MATRHDLLMRNRTRLARDLQDTLLQTIEASKLIADDALDQPRDTAHMLDAMRRLSNWMGQATTEARAALQSLRAAELEYGSCAQMHESILSRARAYFRALLRIG